MRSHSTLSIPVLTWENWPASQPASRLSDADAIALAGLVGTLYEDADRLLGYADEVKAGRITRGK
jgi:hypothetical protein